MRSATLAKLTVIAVLAAIGIGELYEATPAEAGPAISAKTPATPGGFGEVKAKPKPRVGDYYDSGCILVIDDDPPTAPCGEDEFEFTYAGGVLHSLHRNATYNCCPDDLVVSLRMVGDVIRLTEEEVLTFPCDCDCCYNVESDVVGLLPGAYTLIYEWFDYETGNPASYTTEIEILDADAPQVINVDSVGCLDNPEDPQYPPCGDDVITYSPSAGGLYVLHEHATYNCCPDEVLLSVEIVDGVIYLTEEELLDQGCYCICCFTVDGLLVNVAPGEYDVEFCWYDYETETTMCDYQRVVVPAND